MINPLLVLASASPRRNQLLRQLGVAFQIVPGEVTEIVSQSMPPAEICQINAYRKARSVAKHYPDAVVLGADTLVCLGRNVFGKPADLNQAFQMLSMLQGQTHEVITAVCLMHLREHRQRTFAVSTTVRFRALRTSEIRHYFALVNPFDKAGAYAIQEQSEMLVDGIEGSLSNVIGLPLERLGEELAAWGFIVEKNSGDAFSHNSSSL
ncbi:MAG TPA: Maf family protein [Verrucomicrobiae bacterium]|nr:Maf family protein [Verrucomicrobiae bacterium]